MRPVRLAPESRLPSVAFALGLALLALGVLGTVVDVVPGSPVAGPGLSIDLDLEFVGLVVGVGAILGERVHTRQEPTIGSTPTHTDVDPAIYVTRPLLETLLDRAGTNEPDPVSVGLAVTPAAQLDGGDDLDGDIPVFTHIYLPERWNSASFVFGVDLQTPPGRTQGRFVSHPLSALELTKRDDLAEVVLVAVPPWDEASVAAFDRHGRRHPLRTIDATPPADPLPGADQQDFETVR